MQFLLTLGRLLFRYGTGVALFAMTALTSADVLLRWSTGKGMLGIIDATGLLLLLFFFMTIPHSWSANAHVRMDLIYDRLGRTPRLLVDLVGTLGAGLFVGLIGFRSLAELPQMFAAKVSSQTIAIPHWPVAAAIGFLCILSFAGIAADLVRSFEERR